MKRFAVFVTPNAEQDIRQALAWLRREDPAHADAWLREIRDAVVGLEVFPESHPLAPESAAFDHAIRQRFVGKGTPWRVLFTIIGDRVWVLHVRHGRQDYWRP